MSFFARNIRPTIIVLGFLSTVAGTLGSFLLLEGPNARLRQLSDARSGAVREIDKLGALNNAYFIANQQGDLIFALNLQDSSRKEIGRLLYQGNVLDRAEPIRNVIGALAIARLVDYRKTYGDYERLSDAARASGEYGPFLAVKKAEREVIQQAQQRVESLQLGLGPLQTEASLVEATLRRRQAVLIAFSLAGACLLLLANLLEHKVKTAEKR